MHYIQIPKFLKEKRGTDEKLDQWMHFIGNMESKEARIAMEKNKEIKKAKEEYEYLTGKAAERRLAFLRESNTR